jgi:hypothetical protein
MMSPTVRAALAAIAVSGMLAVPAIATASDTVVSFTVAASGSLAIGQDASTATLTNKLDPGNALGFSSTLPGVVSGVLPTTTVTDTRGTLVAAWTVGVGALGDWVNTDDSNVTVGAAQGRSYIDLADTTALVTSAALNPLNGLLTGGEFAVGVGALDSPYTLLSGTSTQGNMTIVFTPTVDVTIPTGTPAGTYSATVQQTVS